MQLTDELMVDLGFTKKKTSWVDDHSRIYFDQLPLSLKELKDVLCGTAHNKGYRKGLLEASLPTQTPNDSL